MEPVQRHGRSFRGIQRRASLKPSTLIGLAAAVGPLWAASSPAADVTAASAATTQTPAKSSASSVTLEKPNWLSEVSVSLKESYDNNVFLAGANSKYFPATVTVPASSVKAVKDKDSFVTTVSPKVGLNFAPLFGEQTTVQALTLAYAPDFVTYHAQDSESYAAHRIVTGIKGKADALSYGVDNTFTYISGSKYGAVYPGSLNSAYATGTIRERREQFQDRSSAVFTYDLGDWFIRPTGSLLYYDLRTEKLAGVTGYQNYADRYDVNGGSDIGYRLEKNLALTLGYRYGAQYQEQYSHAIDSAGLSSSSDYQRLLAGFEGKPLDWLEVKVQAGPDFRSYGPNAPVSDRDDITYYGEASVTATLSKSDTLSLGYKEWRWVSSTGRVPYFDSNYDLSYRHKFDSQLSGLLGARLQESDYTCGNTTLAGSPVNFRDDIDVTFSAGLNYAFTQNLSASLLYTADLGINNQGDHLGYESDGTYVGDTREFVRHIISLGVAFKF